MLGCILIAFNLCAPPGYYGGGGSYAYAQSGYYAQPQYYAPQPVYVVQPQPVYITQPQYYGGYGYGQRPFGVNVGVGPRGGVRVGVGF